MPSPLSVVVWALAIAAFATSVGLVVARRVFAGAIPTIALAPSLGWASVSVASLLLLSLVGFSRINTAALLILCAALSVVALVPRPAAAPPGGKATRLPLLAILAAGLVALIPAAGVMPKPVDSSLALSVPVFDHAKIALTDSLVRLGLPPVNPVFGAAGSTGGVAYYYLWHFSAAMVAMATGISGWEADAALTWFTAWSSLLLIMGLAMGLSPRPASAFVALALALVGSWRPVLERLFGEHALAGLLYPERGFAGWLFQASWSPQHMQSACCAVLALLIAADLAHRRPLTAPIVLALLLAAGFQSSLWIGGMVLPVAAAAVAVVTLFEDNRKAQTRYLVMGTAAAVVGITLCLPMLVEQYHAALQRDIADPVTISPQQVMGPLLPETARRLLDIPAFWALLLPIAFPAAWPLGAIVITLRLRAPAPAALPFRPIRALAILAGTSLLVAWLVTSRVGDNNDLGWRAVLPAAIVLTASAAAGVTGARVTHRRAFQGIAVMAVLLGLPHTVDIALHNMRGSTSVDNAAFAGTERMWAAVRRHSAASDRIANNPLFLEHLTPWPVNFSWAVLSNRSSCYAGREMALALAPLPADRRETIDAQFVRVFAGHATTEDVDDLAHRYDCRVAVVTARDGAWRHDPFADSRLYTLAEDTDRWRIYVRTVGLEGH